MDTEVDVEAISAGVPDEESPEVELIVVEGSGTTIDAHGGGGV